MIARILLLQEKPQNIHNVQKALLECEFRIADTIDGAMALIDAERFDLIVSAVHLEYDGSVFDFLKMVKQNPSTATVPFVFYCSQSSTFARSVRHGLQIASRALGAEQYITMEEFDVNELRHELVQYLPMLKPDISEELAGDFTFNVGEIRKSR
jgi:CheY-like chemotaxis protein